MSEQPSLILCMDNALGEEVALRIEPDDDFHVFLSKAKSALGYEVDINSITNNQPVSLDDNIYHFLLNSEHCLTIDPETGQAYAPDNPDDLLYILDDGTQIKSSQIHFDNEDPVLDLTEVKIPFVKYNDDGDDEENIEVQDIKNYNIFGSPVPQWCSDGSTSRSSFVKSLPFKLVCNDTAAFNAQYAKYLQVNNDKTYATLSNASSDKSPRSLISDNFKKNGNRNPTDDFTNLTREEILNMFKDLPAVPNNNYCVNEKRRHVRKTDPSRPGDNCWSSNFEAISGPLLCPTKSQNCFICGVFVDKDKFYLFDNEDQRMKQTSTPKKMTTQLKIICKECLDKNFKHSKLKDPNQGLESDEYLVIQNNQQYVFRKTGNYKCNFGQAKEIINKIESQMSKQKKDKLDFVKLEIGSDGEVTKLHEKDDVIIIKDEIDDSDVEIIDPVEEIDDTVIENLENADEEVMQFLGKRQGDEADKELKCRFCGRVFEELQQVIEHGEEHKHDLDDGQVFPCPLCDYGYAKFLWLKGHLKAAHEKTKKEEMRMADTKDNIVCDVEAETDSTEQSSAPAALASPIAPRTRLTARKQPEGSGDSKTNEIPSAAISNTVDSNGAEPSLTLKAEVKQEVVETSDEEAIWIVQASLEGNQLSNIVQENQKDGENATQPQTCHNCDQPLPPKGEPEHRCRKRGRKRKPKESDTVVYVPTHEDFLKRAQGRPGTGADCSGNNHLVTRKKKKNEPTSDPQILTCHNCNASFTSKVRLKFHMQFHSSNGEQTSGTYNCSGCHATMATESELFDHVHFQHHKQRRWQCPVLGCGKSFYLRATLTKHSRTHTDTRRYVCVTCGKKFLDKQTLDEHGVTHLQIKPFQCHICMKQLTRRSRLRMHLRAHEEELRPVLLLVCAQCQRAFRDQREAEEHATKSAECIEAFTNTLKEEAEENCLQLSPTSGLVRPINKEDDKDDISFAIPREVTDARALPLLAPLLDAARPLLRVVEIDKAFRCEYCEDVFYWDEGLNKHRQIHKGVKNPFICHICKVTFATYSRCTTHKTTHGFYKRSLEDAKRLALHPGPPTQGGASAIGILGYGGFPVVKHFLCEDCGRSYLHWTYLQVHRRMKHNNDNYIFKCNYCTLTFPNVWSVTYHRKKIHGKTGHDNRDGGVTKVLKEDHRIPCRDCDKILPHKIALYKHRKEEHSDMTLMDNNSEDGDSAENRPQRRHNSEYHSSNPRRPMPNRSRFKQKNELKNGRIHPINITVIELEGLNPSPQAIMNSLSMNNIIMDKVFEISKMTFPKGSRNTIPSCTRALAALGNVPAENINLSNTQLNNEYSVAALSLPRPTTAAPRHGTANNTTAQRCNAMK